jgi:hypothetical protein
MSYLSNIVASRLSETEVKCAELVERMVRGGSTKQTIIQEFVRREVVRTGRLMTSEEQNDIGKVVDGVVGYVRAEDVVNRLLTPAPVVVKESPYNPILGVLIGAVVVGAAIGLYNALSE